MIKFIDSFDTIHGIYESKLFNNDKEISKCRICAYDDGIWSVSQWYTNNDLQHNGYGKEVMKHVLESIFKDKGLPSGIRYVWNGTNDYVMEWLKTHFSPISMLPIQEQKYGSSDDWRAHIYDLDMNAFLDYFDIEAYLPDNSPEIYIYI